VDRGGKKNYAAVQPKCGVYYRDGRHTKVGVGAANGRGRALSCSSTTGPQNNIYEYVGGEILFERRRVPGSTGIHVSMNATQEMYGVNTDYTQN
jgi:hypothetical protein